MKLNYKTNNILIDELGLDRQHSFPALVFMTIIYERFGDHYL